MKKDYLRIGDEIRTPEGWMTLDSYNGHIVYCTEYRPILDDDFNDTGEIETEERMLTPNEIGDILRSVDDQNHKVIIVSDDEEDEDDQ